MFNGNGGYSLADIAAVSGGKSSGGDGFGFNGDGAWVLLLFIILLACGNWGNNNNGGNTNGGGSTTAYVVGDVQRGFDQSAIINELNGISSAVSSGFSNAEISRCNSQANILQTLNNNQSNLCNQLNTIAMNQQNCCCENRASLADLKYTIATENCADRAALSDALRDIITSNNSNTQVILDKLCQQEIDALKAQNQQLQMQSYLANLAASQNAQTGQILTDNAAQTAALIQALNPTPIPAYVVANPNGCGCNCGNNYGCGGNGFYN